MAVTITATPGASNANSYATVAEANAYFAGRLPLVPSWEEAADPTAALAMATRVLDAMFRPHKVLKRDAVNGDYYLTYRHWTGTPATTTQRLAWPRTGMYDGNGNAIAANVIPQELKDAQAELAGQLAVSDTTLDNAVNVQGLTGLTAGSIQLTFKEAIETRVLPDAVWNLLPPSWFTEEVVEPAMRAQFDVI